MLTAACLLILLNVAEGAHPVHAMAFPDRAIFAVSIAFWCVVAPCWLWLKLRVRNHAALIVAGLVVLLPVWLALVRLQSNPELLLPLLAVVWISDSAAYFAGRALGRHKLAPPISPGKTWEGVGGAFAAVAVYALDFAVIIAVAGADLPFVIAAFFGITALGILGDLLESWLKRGAGVKDSGSCLPGHGGDARSHRRHDRRAAAGGVDICLNRTMVTPRTSSFSVRPAASASIRSTSLRVIPSASRSWR